MRDFISDLEALRGALSSSDPKRAKILVLINLIQSGDFDVIKSNFPHSRLHYQLLLIGNSNMLYKMEREGYRLKN